MMAHARARFGRLRSDLARPRAEDGAPLLEEPSARSDLALEAHSFALQRAQAATLPGVQSVEEDLGFGTLTRLTVENELGAQLIGKPVGTYTTLHVPRLQERRREIGSEVSQALAREIEGFLEEAGLGPDAPVLVVGLGNWNATADNVGPLTTSKLLVTRHLHEYQVLDAQVLGRMRPVAALSPGVLGLTGVETAEIVRGVVERVRPRCVICVDALASRSVERLGTTFQMSDAGIHPGSGVGNTRAALNEESLGVPVLALGCPTVIYATTMVSEALDRLAERQAAPAPGPSGGSLLDPARIRLGAGPSPGGGAGANRFAVDPQMRQGLMEEVFRPFMGQLIVTPKEVDLLVESLSDILADALNEALHPGLSAEEAALLR